MIIIVHRRYIVNKSEDESEEIFNDPIIIIRKINLGHSYGIPYDATVGQYDIYRTILQDLS